MSSAFDSIARIAERITGAVSGNGRQQTSQYGPALAPGFPAKEHGWNRPWGRIETTSIRTRKSAKMLSVNTAERQVAILTTITVTPELLNSRTWRRARALRRNRLSDAFVLPLAATLLIGGILLGTVLLPLASVAALATLLILGLAAGLAGLTWYRSATQQATATLQQEGHDWREIELGADDLATLISRLDALAFDWENGKVSDEVWHTAWKLTYEVASAAFRGALIDETNYEFRIARDYIDAARDALGTSGRVDELPAPQQA